MKKNFYIALSTLLCMGAVSLTSCDTGTGTGTDPGPVTPEGPITELKMTVDKSTIEADNKDVATFTITDQNGRVLNDVKGMRVMMTDSGSLTEGVTTTAYANGEVKYNARYNGMRSNTVVVTGANRKKYEKYYRHVALFQFTGEWCQNCPSMTKVLDALEKETPDRFVRMAFHYNDHLEIPTTQVLTKSFGINAYPTALIDMSNKLSSYDGTSIRNGINKSMKELPAACGIKITTKYDPETKIVSISPEVMIDVDGEYSIAWAVLTDNLPSVNQLGASASYVHNNTVRVALNNPSGGFMSADGKLAAGTKWVPSAAEAETFKTPALTDKLEDMSIVVYVLKKEGNNFIINNIAKCAANNGSVEAKLND